jgi:hypothetical protein
MCQIIGLDEIVRRKEAEKTIQQLKRSAMVQLSMLADSDDLTIKELNVVNERLKGTLAKIFTMRCFENSVDKIK